MSTDFVKEYEFKAGLMTFDSASKKVTADKRRGTVKIGCTLEGEKPFTWTSEGSSQAEFEYAVMQGDATFELSKQMKRVVVLRFECDESRYFFWLQEKDVSKDGEIVRRVQEIIDFDVESLMIDESPQVIETSQPNNQQPATQSVPTISTTPSTTAATTNPSLTNANLFGEQFQNLFNNMIQSSGGNNNNDRMMQQYLQQYQNQHKQKETPNFMEVLTKESMQELANDPEVQKELIQQKENLICPQYQQALESLEKALNSEEGAAVLVSLGLDSTNFMNTLDGSDSFYKAIIKWAEEENKKQ